MGGIPNEDGVNAGRSTVIGDISRLILASILRQYPNNFNDQFIRTFLHTPQGYNLIFNSMNICSANNEALSAAGAPFFREDVSPITRAIDVHTHFAETQTQAGSLIAYKAEGLWWFCPDRYQNLTTSQDLVALDTCRASDNEKQSVLKCNYKRLMLDRKPKGRKYISVLSNVPRDDGELLSIDLMNSACCEFSSHQGGLLVLPSNWIRPNGHIEGTPGRSRIWKFYPRNVNAPLSESTPTLIDGLDLILKANPKERQIICIHCGDDFSSITGEAGSTTDTTVGVALFDDVINLMKQAELLREGAFAFVLFHGGFAEHKWVSKAMRSPVGRDRLYCDFAGVFASLILHLKPNPARVFRDILGLNPDGSGDPDENLGAFNQVVWGTDSIWRGSPWWEVEAFNRLKISNKLREPKWERKFKNNVLRFNARDRLKIVNEPDNW
jgi:hypothetical protein